MPINRLLKIGKYTPEEIELLNRAFDLALRSMGLVDRNDPLYEMIARKIIEAVGSRTLSTSSLASARTASPVPRACIARPRIRPSDSRLSTLSSSTQFN